MNPSTRDDFLWLISDDAAPVLTQVQQEFEDKINVVRIAKRLRKTHAPSRSAIVMEQAQLRIRARRKFSNPEKMFFTRRGLEQSSGKSIAAYKASQWSAQGRVADICCGIGGDLIEFARRNANGQTDSTRRNSVSFTCGVDSDELTCLFARKNLKAILDSAVDVTVDQVDFSNFDVSKFDSVHIDPDRRLKSRTVHGSQFSPNLRQVFERIGAGTNLAVKVAPATPSSDYFPSSIQREWIGDERECKQQILWAGPETKNPGHRTATFVRRNGAVHQLTAHENELTKRSAAVGIFQRFIAEPHPAVLAARLTDHLALQHGMNRFTVDVVYLTGNDLIDDPLFSQFEIIEVLPLNLKQVRSSLISLDVGTFEIKRRGVEEESAKPYEKLKLDGTQTATLILTRLGKKRIAIVAKRCGTNTAGSI